MYISHDELEKIVARHNVWLDTQELGEKANFNECDLRGANFSGMRLNRVNFRNADLSGADFSGASLKFSLMGFVNLTGANLSNANLTEAFLHGADLTGANLEDVNMTNADLTGAIGKFYTACFFNKHNAIAVDGWISIGCERYPYYVWLSAYERIGRKHKYSEEQIKAYGDWIKVVSDLMMRKQRLQRDMENEKQQD